MDFMEVGNFNIPTGGGATLNVLHRDSSFEASGFLFFSCDPAWFATNGFFGVGHDDGTNHFGTAVSIGGFGPQHFWADDASIVGGITTFSFELRLRGYVTAKNIGSFDLAFPINTTNGGQLWTYVAFSTQYTQCKSMNIGGTFPKTLTPGFAPVSAIGLWHGGASGGTFTGSGAQGAATFGFGSSCGASQVCLSNDIYKTYQHQGKFLTRINSSGTIINELEITGWDDTTLTINGTNTGEYASALVIGGGSVNVDIFTQPTATIPTIATDLVGVLVASFCNTTSLTAINGLRASLGATDGTFQETKWIGADANHTADSIRVINPHLLTLAHPTGDPAKVIDGQADFTSFGSNSINTNWTTDDGIARECFYLVFSVDPSEPPFCGGVCCTDGKRRIEVHLNGKRQFSASIAKDSYSFAGLIDALKNDIVTIVAYQEDGSVLNCIPSVEVHRVSYVQHLKESGRNYEEPD